MRRGELRVYLGAAPGVGKTFAMLDEGHRRVDRGTDVVIAFVESHGRAQTEQKAEGLDVVPRRMVNYRGVELAELDLAAVLARAPQVALVDELAHSNAPGCEHSKRWQDVAALLEAGIDVISTVNVQHLESLNDVVEAITGVAQHETVPDAVVRAAEQVELVDMTAQALRRRMAHGNIYTADKVDAALGNYFRPGNLTALRELALLWLANSVEDGLQRYREQHGITATWETRERIVVALTGGPEGDALIRRAGRIAARASAADLHAVHVARSDGLAGASIAALDRQRLLVESLGGSFHSVIGDEVAAAVLDFARAVNATQIVLGASRRHPIAVALTGLGTGMTIARGSGSIDVHVVSHDYVGRGRLLPQASPGGINARRRLAGLFCAVVLLSAATVTLTTLRTHVSFGSDLCVYLLIVIITSLVGGFYPALAAAILASVLLNYYFAPPIHTFTIAEGDNIVALIIFVLVTVLVSRVVDLAARRLVLASRSSAEAETLSTLAGSLLRGEQALPALLERVRETFGMRSVSLLRRSDSQIWEVLASLGPGAPELPSEADCVADVDEAQVLAANGRTLRAEDQRVLAAFAAQVAVAYRQRELAAAALAVEPLAESERARTALLNAVSHDLRTPIASAKAAVSSLRADDIGWTDQDRRELLATADHSLDRLTDLVTNLLDLSRLQAGVLPVHCAPVALEEVVRRAVDTRRDTNAVQVTLPEQLPEVDADAGLLERVVANLVENAVRFSPAGVPVRVTASTRGGEVELRVIDEGPGIAPDDAQRVFAPFQRQHDAPSTGTGVGLGLAIARGFAAAMGGGVDAEQTPGGGATLVVTLRTSPVPRPVEPVTQ